MSPPSGHVVVGVEGFLQARTDVRTADVSHDGCQGIATVSAHPSPPCPAAQGMNRVEALHRYTADQDHV